MTKKQTFWDTTENILNYLRNKSTPYILATGVAATVLAGCKDTKTELSEILHDEATIESKQYVVHPDDDQFNWGIVFGSPSAAVILSEYKHYYIVFQSKKIRFNVYNKELFNRFNTNDIADVTYREVYRLTYDDIDGDGKTDLVNKVLTDYKFLDAQPK